MPAYEVGQALWFVPSHRNADKDGDETTVEKVGRKWVTLSNGFRIDFSGRADSGDYGSRGFAYESREAFEAARERNKAWSVLLDHLRHRFTAPDGLTTEEIIAITAQIKGPKT